MKLAAADADRERLNKEWMQAQIDLAAAKEAAKHSPPVAPPDKALEGLTDELEKLGTPRKTAGGERGIAIGTDVLFRAGKTDISSAGKSTLAKVAAVAKKAGPNVIIFIDGHTDSDPLRVTKKLYGDNYGLGAARGNAVAKELVALGVPKFRLVVRSFGPDFPAGDNKTSAGKQLNRRVEISFANSATPLNGAPPKSVTPKPGPAAKPAPEAPPIGS